MSDELQVIKAEEAKIEELHHQLAEQLDDLRRDVCEVARHGAELGRYVEGWRQSSKVKSDEEFWNKLRKLNSRLREDVIRFSFRSLAAQRKCAALDDPSQLTFALACEQAGQERATPQRRETNELMLLTNACQRTVAFVREWQQREPLQQWADTVKQSARDLLEPLVELYEQLKP